VLRTLQMSRHLGSAGVCLAIFLLATLLGTQQSLAWGNGGYSSDPEYPDYGIHDWIADKALAFQTADVSFLTSTYHADYLIGTEAPDNDAYIGDWYNHHVYYTSSGAIQSDIGASRSQAMYQAALVALGASDFKQAAYYAGAMAHYVSDLGAYGHTMGAGTEWGQSRNHSDYEEQVADLLGSLSAPAAEPVAPKDPYEVAVSLARETTFGSGVIRANTWMEANYDWGNPAFRASCFESLNESVRAVAGALGKLLLDAGLNPIPEFWLPAFALLATVWTLLVVQRAGSRR